MVVVESEPEVNEEHLGVHKRLLLRALQISGRLQ